MSSKNFDLATVDGGSCRGCRADGPGLLALRRCRLHQEHASCLVSNVHERVL